MTFLNLHYGRSRQKKLFLVADMCFRANVLMIYTILSEIIFLGSSLFIMNILLFIIWKYSTFVKSLSNYARKTYKNKEQKFCNIPHVTMRNCINHYTTNILLETVWTVVDYLK